MKLIVGGYSQGKLNYVMQKRNVGQCIIWDGKIPNEEQVQEAVRQGKQIIINHFHNWVRECILQGEKPEEILSFFTEHPEIIIISDEIGNGIVPIDALEREYRERTGRILVKLASQADEVVRVICGIGQKIK